MCNYQKLACTEKGYVVKCEKCNCYSVAFGTSTLTLSEMHFRHFAEIIKERISVQHSNEYPAKNVYIPSPADGFGLILTFREAVDFLEILESAANEERVLKMIKMFAG